MCKCSGGADSFIRKQRKRLDIEHRCIDKKCAHIAFGFAFEQPHAAWLVIDGGLQSYKAFCNRRKAIENAIQAGNDDIDVDSGTVECFGQLGCCTSCRTKTITNI